MSSRSRSRHRRGPAPRLRRGRPWPGRRGTWIALTTALAVALATWAARAAPVRVADAQASPAGTGSAGSSRTTQTAQTARTTQTTQTTRATRTTQPTQPTQPSPVDTALAAMDLPHQVAQLFVVGVRLADLDRPGAGDAVAGSGAGGIFLAGRSRLPATALALTTARWRAEAAGGVRPWVATDQEGGAVQALSGPGFARLPTARAQGLAAPGERDALADGLGASMASAGVDLDLAPVADAVPAGTERANAPIGAFGRQYAATPAGVLAPAGAIIAGLHAHGVTATLKHFPGLGRVRANTDTSDRVVDDVTTADDAQVAAFAALARSPGSPFVMVSSAVYTHLDPTQPAVFSPAVITSLLRTRLGHRGVVISDDLTGARAVTAVPAGERAVRFLAAGGTLVLAVDPTVAAVMERAVLARATSDPAFAATVTAAARTALTAKAAAGLLP